MTAELLSRLQSALIASFHFIFQVVYFGANMAIGVTDNQVPKLAAISAAR